MTSVAVRVATPTRRIVLLAGQAFALGLMMAWILVPASAIFLEAYGSGLLPVTYIGAAAAGIASSASLSAVLRRRTLSAVAAQVLAGLACLLATAWVLLWKFEAEWVSFGLLVLVPIIVPIGFVFVVGQAGMLLDVRVLKATYARVIAGFALGFVAGGLAGSPLLRALGGTEHLLAAAALVAGTFLLLVEVTRRTFSAELSVVDVVHEGAERPTLRVLLRHRYITLIVAFQMLSAVESQWLDYLVFDRASRRYEDSEELAQFIGRFTAIAYGADILFLLLVAGLLLRRFGLRYGLTANSVAVMTLIGGMILAASLQGSAATIVFVLIVAARVTDLVFSDGTSRTSLSAAYQVVPSALRLVTQAKVEGLAVPVAIGASGVILVVLRWAGGTEGILLPVLTSVVVAAWIVVAALVYRGYRVSLLASLRRRTLDPAALNLDGADGLVVIERLVDSDDERDVRLALDVLAGANHAALPAILSRLTEDQRLDLRATALERLMDVEPQMAAVAARRGLTDPSFRVRAVSIRVLAAVGGAADVDDIAASANDSPPDVMVAAAAAITRLGSDAGRVRVAADLVRLARSRAAQDRVIAAQMFGECEPGEWMDRSVLRALLDDPDHDVVNAALAATRWPHEAELVHHVTDHLHDRRTSIAAVDALVRGRDSVLDHVEDHLHGHAFGRRGQVMLARVCRRIGGVSARNVLHRHVDHPDREVGLAVMTALAALAPQGTAGGAADDFDAAEMDQPGHTAVVRADLEHATYVLRALVALDGLPSTDLLRAALRDELDLVRQRLVVGLSMRHGTETLDRVQFQFAQHDPRSHALALEWLDVTLTGADRAVVAMLEPGMSDHERLRALARRFPVAAIDPVAAILELAHDRDRRWRRPWITACAIQAAAVLADDGVESAMIAEIESAINLDDHDDEIVRETLFGIRQRRSAGRSRLDPLSEVDRTA